MNRGGEREALQSQGPLVKMVCLFPCWAIDSYSVVCVYVCVCTCLQEQDQQFPTAQNIIYSPLVILTLHASLARLNCSHTNSLDILTAKDTAVTGQVLYVITREHLKGKCTKLQRVVLSVERMVHRHKRARGSFKWGSVKQVFWWKFSLRLCVENSRLRITSVSGATSICCQPDEFVKSSKLNTWSKCAVITW